MEKVASVSVINDVAEIYGDGELVAKLEYPQAIALHTKSGVIMLDKEVWFSETIVIKRGLVDKFMRTWETVGIEP